MLADRSARPVFVDRVPLVADEEEEDGLSGNEAEELCDALSEGGKMLVSAVTRIMAPCSSAQAAERKVVAATPYPTRVSAMNVESEKKRKPISMMISKVIRDTKIAEITAQNRFRLLEMRLRMASQTGSSG